MVPFDPDGIVSGLRDAYDRAEFLRAGIIPARRPPAT